MRDLRDSIGSQDSLMTARSGVKDTGQRPSKLGTLGHTSASGYSRQTSEPVTQDEQETVTVNGKRKKIYIGACVCVFGVCVCVCLGRWVGGCMCISVCASIREIERDLCIIIIITICIRHTDPITKKKLQIYACVTVHHFIHGCSIPIRMLHLSYRQITSVI